MSASWWDKPADQPESFKLLTDDIVLWSNDTWRSALAQMWPIPLYFLLITAARLALHYGLLLPWARLMLPKKKNAKFFTAPDSEAPHPSLPAMFARTHKPNEQQYKELAAKSQLSPSQLADWFRRMRRGVQARKAETKFTESGWKFIYYSLSAVYGIHTISSKWWLSDTRRAYWYEFPNPIDPQVETYYAVTFAFYCHMLVSLVWFEERKKDYWQMFAHHWITLLLIGCSWVIGLSRIGCVLLVLHDLADPWLEIAKIFSYAEWRWTCDSLFAVFAVVFGVTRLGLYPRWVCFPALIETIPLHDTPTVYLYFNALLLALLGLNAFWFSLVLRMAFQLLFTTSFNHRDTRSESDALSDEPEKAPKHASPDGLRHRHTNGHSAEDD